MTTAIKTAGTPTTTSMTNALQWFPGYGSGVSAADLATIDAAIVNDQGNVRTNYGPFGLDGNGILTLPGGRGQIKLLPGDWVIVDKSGWPIVVSGNVLPTTLTLTGTTNSTKTLTVTTSAWLADWNIGMVISGSAGDIPTATPTTITAISLDGKTITMSAAATGSNAGQTITAGTWTHS